MPYMRLKKLAVLLKTGTKNKERIQSFEEAGHLKYIYQNKLNKVRFGSIWLMEILKSLPRRTTSDKCYLTNFNIAKNSNFDRYQDGLNSMLCKIFTKSLKIHWSIKKKQELILKQYLM